MPLIPESFPRSIEINFLLRQEEREDPETGR